MGFRTGSIVQPFSFCFRIHLIGAFIFSLCIIIPAYVITDRSLTKIEKQRIAVIYMIAFSSFSSGQPSNSRRLAHLFCR